MSDEYKKNPNLTQKQKRFVAGYSTGQVSATQAVIDAGYAVQDRDSAQAMGSKLLRHPKIQNALAAAIDKDYPNLPQKAAERVYSILADDNQNPLVWLKYLEFAAKVFGWHAPTKHASLNVSFKDRINKLPED